MNEVRTICLLENQNTKKYEALIYISAGDLRGYKKLAEFETAAEGMKFLSDYCKIERRLLRDSTKDFAVTGRAF